jgi:rhodanese-related sulfurtransferase
MFLLATALLAGPAACEFDAWLERHGGVARFREIGSEEARALLSEPTSLLVQAEDPPGPGGRVAEALLLPSSKPLPASVIQGSGAVVVLAHELRVGRRLAARLVRAGRSRVAVVRGGIEAWGREGHAVSSARSTAETASARLPRMAGPRDPQGEGDDGGSSRDHGPEL